MSVTNIKNKETTLFIIYSEELGVCMDKRSIRVREMVHMMDSIQEPHTLLILEPSNDL